MINFSLLFEQVLRMFIYMHRRYENPNRWRRVRTAEHR